MYLTALLYKEPTMLRLIRLPEVKHLTGLSSATIYRHIAKKQFPASIQLGTRAVAWSSEDIEAWVGERIEKAGKSA